MTQEVPEPAAQLQRRPADPEKGLRGIMSATLVLEAITVLLSIPVAANTGSGVGVVGISIICLLAVLLVVVGVQFVSIGLLGEMLARAYHESQGKPIYVIKEEF